MQASSQTMQAPSPVIRAAQTHQLGKMLDSHGVSTGKAYGGIGFGIVMLLFGGGLGYLGIPSSIVMTGFGLFLAVLGIVLALRSWNVLRSSLTVYLCEQGFIYSQANVSPQPFRWDQIQVWRSVTKHYRNGSYVGTVSVYKIQRQDGYRIGLDNDLQQIQSLGETICEQVARWRMPQALQAYHMGQTVQFGTLSLNQQGIYNGSDMLPWSQVEAIDVKEGVVNVKRWGSKSHWCKVAASAIPNVFVFLALVTLYRSSSRVDSSSTPR